MPEEELLVGGGVEGGETEFGGRVQTLLADVTLDAVVDAAPRLRLLHVVGEAEVLLQHQLEVALGVGTHELDAQLVSPRFLPALPQTAVLTVAAHHPAQIDPFEAFYQTVALHKLVVKVGQGLWFLAVNHDAQPESQTGNVDGTPFDIDPVDVVFDDLFL